MRKPLFGGMGVGFDMGFSVGPAPIHEEEQEDGRG
jgi:hypothetical protein